MHGKWQSIGFGLLGLAGLAVAGCQMGQAQPAAESPAPTKAVAVVHALGDTKTAGTVTFTQVADGVKIEADITGLTEGKHGFHVHEFGDCSSLDGKSAGGHFNPDGKPHAGPDSPERHVGDFGNLEAAADGKAHYSRVDNLVAMSGPHSVIGRAIIIHAGEDDLKSQPSGDAGRGSVAP